jgi:hypothetical protein
MLSRLFRLTIVLLAAAQAQQQPPDPIIETARKASAAFAHSLPDYVVKRTTTRYLSRRITGRLPSVGSMSSWEKVDSVTVDLAAVHGTETYSNIKVNGKPAKTLPGGGVWSSGEFSTMLSGILSPASAGSFTHQRSEQLGKRASWHYDFAVDQPHSGWSLQATNIPGVRDAMSYSPAYGGQIWIDSETGQVLKFTIEARDVPTYFPLNVVNTAVEYEFVQIGDGTYCLPTHSVALTCQRDGNACYRNENVFRDYGKFGANTSITFDSGAK